MKPQGAPVHATRSSTLEVEGRHSAWLVMCHKPGCGWYEEGTYPNFGPSAEVWALRMAHALGDRHELLNSQTSTADKRKGRRDK